MKRFILSALIVGAAAFSAPAQAATETPFNTAAFAEAQAKGEPILVDVSAWWCPVCASQRSTIKRLVEDKRYASLHILKLNYDKQKAEWRALGVTKQATLIAYKGRHEVGRIAYQTDHAQIENLLLSAVK